MRDARVYRYLHMYDSNMGPCFDDGMTTLWCCSEKITKGAEPGELVYNCLV